MSGRVRCGVAGWSYEDWKGIVYPRGCKDRLRAVAKLVDFIEINTTFYRTPLPAVVASWVERTADLGTRFTAKLPQALTHEGVFEPAVARAFRSAVEPLIASGRLDALLAQFSYRLGADDDGLLRLREVAAQFGDEVPLLLEVRHGSWRVPAAQARARDLGFRLVHLDYAAMDSGFIEPSHGLHEVRGIEYLRVHGRNRAAWFDKEAGRNATYDWLYAADEVAGLQRRLAAIVAAATTANAMVAANNHFQGKALVLALELTAWARGGPVEVPATLVATYPQLAGIAQRAQRGLFDG